MRKWVISSTGVSGGHGSLIAPAAVNNVSFSSIRNDKFQETVASFPGLPSNKVNFARSRDRCGSVVTRLQYYDVIVKGKPP